MDPSSSSSSSSIASTSRISRQVFLSALPVVISLDVSDLPPSADGVLASELVHCATVRRNSYLPFLVAEAKETLLQLVLGAANLKAVRDEDLWFECRGVPLRWHWPFGLLYDQSVNNLAATNFARSPGPSTSLNVGVPPLPWSITLRLKNLPHAKLPPPSSNPTLVGSSGAGHLDILNESAKQAYMSMLKEADFIRNGSTKKVNNLRREEQDGIWEALKNGEWNHFTSLTAKILPPPAAYPTHEPSSNSTAATPSKLKRQSTGVPNSLSSHDATMNNLTPSLAQTLGKASGEGSGLGQENTAASPSLGSVGGLEPTALASGLLKGQTLPSLRAIPVRFILQGGLVLSEGVPPLMEDGRLTTLQTLLSALFPALFPPPVTPVPQESSMSTLGLDFSTQAAAEGPASEGKVPNRTSSMGQTSSAPLAVPIVQGIQVPLEATITWIARYLAGADSWITVSLPLLPKLD